MGTKSREKSDDDGSERLWRECIGYELPLLQQGLDWGRNSLQK